MAAVLLRPVCSAIRSTAPWCMPSGIRSSTHLPLWMSRIVYLPGFFSVFVLFGFLVLLEFLSDVASKRDAMWTASGVLMLAT